MSITSISSYNSLYQANVQNLYQQEQQSISDLGNALQLGNLTAAQQAFSAFEQVLNSSQGGSQSQNIPIAPSTTSTGPVNADISALGNALQSQNATSAQTAFNQLLQDLNGVQKGHHHHHHHNKNVNSQNPTTSNPSNTIGKSSTGGDTVGDADSAGGSNTGTGSSVNVTA